MSRFFIYIPGDDRSDPKKLDAVGLSHLKAGANFLPATKGPDGTRGVVLSWPNDPRGPVAFIPDMQNWIPAVPRNDLPAGRYWVGFWKSSKPTPSDLAWGKQFEGGAVTLGDGREWNIPAAGMLPTEYSLSPDTGLPVELIHEQFRDYWEESQKYFEWFVRGIAELEENADPVLKCDASVWMFIEKALSLNYMLTPEVIDHLKLINSDTRGRIVFAAMGGLQVSEDLVTQKKSTDLVAI